MKVYFLNIFLKLIYHITVLRFTYSSIIVKIGYKNSDNINYRITIFKIKLVLFYTTKWSSEAFLTKEDYSWFLKEFYPKRLCAISQKILNIQVASLLVAKFHICEYPQTQENISTLNPQR